jgi:hypothetical protein
MQPPRRWGTQEDEQTAANRQTQSLAGLAVTLFLVVLSLGLVQVLHKKATLEDCLLSGRSNCGRTLSWPVVTTNGSPGWASVPRWLH